MKRVTAALIGTLAASPLLAASALHAQEPVQEEREHVVKDGDTLWDLAGFYYTNPFQWPTIFQANTLVVEDPHWIYPEEVLVIPGVAGETVPREAAPVEPAPVPARTVFYRPPAAAPEREGPTVLEEPGLAVLPVRVGEFNSAPYVMDPDRLQVRGRFMRAVRDDRPGRGRPTSAHPQDRAFLHYAGSGGTPQPGDRLVIVRVGRHVDGTGWGDRLIHPTGIIRVQELTPDVMVGQIEGQYAEVHPDQLVVPLSVFPEFQVESAVPVPGGSDLLGEILEFVDEEPLYGRAALAILDLGIRDGVRVGDVFQAFLPERPMREGLLSTPAMLPPEVVAELRVVRVTDGYATAMVDNVRLSRLGPGLPVHRIRYIP